MKRYLILAPFILLLLVAPVHSKSVLVIYEVDDFGFAQLPAAGWEADVDVRAFDQSIAWRNRRCPTDKDFEDIDGVVYIMNYDAVVPEPLGMALQTLHQVREFVSEGGRAVVLLQSPVRAADESFAGYLRKHFDIIHVAKKCHGDVPQTIVRFPLDGGVLMPELAGTTIGGSELRGLCGWFTVKPGSWLGQSVGSYAPPRYLGAR